jgi:hypothetical protein
MKFVKRFEVGFVYIAYMQEVLLSGNHVEKGSFKYYSKYATISYKLLSLLFGPEIGYTTTI